MLYLQSNVITPDQKVVLRLREVGFSLNDTAEIIGITRDRARKMEFKAGRILQEQEPAAFDEWRASAQNKEKWKPIANKTYVLKETDKFIQIGKIKAYLECGLTKKAISEKLGFNLYELKKLLDEIQKQGF